MNLLQKASQLGTRYQPKNGNFKTYFRLIVGVSSDDLNYAKKGKMTTLSLEERLKTVKMLPFVHSVFVEESLELKRHYLSNYQADILVMGDDWQGKMDQFSDQCNVTYFPRTEGISSTDILERIKK